MPPSFLRLRASRATRPMRGRFIAMIANATCGTLNASADSLRGPGYYFWIK